MDIKLQTHIQQWPCELKIDYLKHQIVSLETIIEFMEKEKKKDAEKLRDKFIIEILNYLDQAIQKSIEFKVCLRKNRVHELMNEQMERSQEREDAFYEVKKFIENYFIKLMTPTIKLEVGKKYNLRKYLSWNPYIFLGDKEKLGCNYNQGRYVFVSTINGSSASFSEKELEDMKEYNESIDKIIEKGITNDE